MTIIPAFLGQPAPLKQEESRYAGESHYNLLLVPYPFEGLGFYVANFRRLRLDHAQEAVKQTRIAAALKLG
jgi:hypothetical protein